MKKWLNTTVSIGVILLIWKLASAMLDRFFLPDPVSTLKKMVELLGNGTLRRHLLKSSYRLLDLWQQFPWGYVWEGSVS